MIQYKIKGFCICLFKTLSRFHLFIWLDLFVDEENKLVGQTQAIWFSRKHTDGSTIYKHINTSICLMSLVLLLLPELQYIHSTQSVRLLCSLWWCCEVQASGDASGSCSYTVCIRGGRQRRVKTRPSSHYNQRTLQLLYFPHPSEIKPFQAEPLMSNVT